MHRAAVDDARSFVDFSTSESGKVRAVTLLACVILQHYGEWCIAILPASQCSRGMYTAGIAASVNDLPVPQVAAQLLSLCLLDNGVMSLDGAVERNLLGEHGVQLNADSGHVAFDVHPCSLDVSEFRFFGVPHTGKEKAVYSFKPSQVWICSLFGFRFRMQFDSHAGR